MEVLVLWLLLNACAPDAGTPDPSDCQPIPIARQCSIWECWQVYDDGVVDYTYAAGWDGKQFSIRSPACERPIGCADQEQIVADKACPDES